MTESDNKQRKHSRFSLLNLFSRRGRETSSDKLKDISPADVVDTCIITISMKTGLKFTPENMPKTDPLAVRSRGNIGRFGYEDLDSYDDKVGDRNKSIRNSRRDIIGPDGKEIGSIEGPWIEHSDEDFRGGNVEHIPERMVFSLRIIGRDLSTTDIAIERSIIHDEPYDRAHIAYRRGQGVQKAFRIIDGRFFSNDIKESEVGKLLSQALNSIPSGSSVKEP